MVHVRWNFPNEESLNRFLVRRRPKLRAKTFAEASKLAAKADAIMEPHHANNDKYRRPGEARSYIDVTPGSIVDAFVNLNDPGMHAHAIEHETRALRKAAGNG